MHSHSIVKCEQRSMESNDSVEIGNTEIRRHQMSNRQLEKRNHECRLS